MTNEQDERPAPPIGIANTILDMVRSGQVGQDPKSLTDTRIYDSETQKPVEVGNNDPNVIGPDDHYEFAYRAPDSYPEVPPQVKTAEIRYILPVAKFIADTIGITVIDESAYERILSALKVRSLFVLLNIHGTKISDGIASWFGLILMCKRHPLVMVRFKMRLGTEQIGIDQVRLWEKRGERYLVHKPNNVFYDREEVSAMVLDYLKNEGVLPEL